MASNKLPVPFPIFERGFQQLISFCIDQEIVRVNRIMDELKAVRDQAHYRETGDQWKSDAEVPRG